MMNRKNIFPSLLTCAAAVALAATLGACSRTASGGDAAVSVEPRVPVLVPDSTGAVNLDLQISVPPRYFSRRSRLTVQPQLHDSLGVLAAYDPLVLDAPVYAQKLHRREALYAYADPQAARRREVASPRRGVTAHYATRAQLPEGPHMGRRIYGVVTTDGCGDCSAVDTILLAAIDDPVDLVKRKYKLEWMDPKFEIKPKIREGRGVARLQFIINRYDIRLDLGSNRAELDTMLARLQPVVSDTLAELTSVHIYGLASADGPLSFNTPLARNRANAAREWLFSRLNLSAAQRRVFTIASRPEGWEPVVQAMTAAGHPDSVRVREILTRYADQNDDVAEYYIRRLSCWPDIRARFLQKDRKVEYVYTYRIRNFTTDEELLRMYAVRPDAFSEAELLRVSTLQTTDEARAEVYRTVLRYFPQSETAANNLAILMLRQNRPDEAERILTARSELTDQLRSVLAATYVYRNQYERAVELLQRVPADDRQGRYNLGIVRACQHRYAEAYELLRPYDDVATAITALSLGRNDEAHRIMTGGKAAADASPLAEYVRAQTAARLERADDVFRSLPQAVTDEWLRTRSRRDYEFEPYHADPRWPALFQTEKE